MHIITFLTVKFYIINNIGPPSKSFRKYNVDFHKIKCFISLHANSKKYLVNLGNSVVNKYIRTM